MDTQRYIHNYYGLKFKKEIESEVRLLMKDNVNSIIFENKDFLLKIIIPDIVDQEEFYNLVRKKNNKIQLLCHLDKDEKEYKGKRKFVWKHGKLSISQGAIRIEFNDNIIEKLKLISQVIKDAYHKI